MKIGFSFAPLFVAAFVSAPLCAWAAPELQPDEIALEGTVRTISAGKIELNAEIFWLPSGKSRPILPAKNKTVEFASKQPLWLPNGAQIPISELAVNSKIRVIGRDLGAGKPLPARRIEFLGGPLGTVEDAARVPETGEMKVVRRNGVPVNEPDAEKVKEPIVEPPKTPEKPRWDRTKPLFLEPSSPPFEPIEGGQERRFRITDSGFAVEQLLSSQGWNGRGNWRSAPVFFARYEDITPPVEPIPGSSEKTATLETRILSPWGLLVEGTVKDNGFVFNSEVDPSWPFVFVEFSGRQPFAADGVLPEEAEGKRTNEFEFRFAPPPDGEAMTPNLTHTTRDGTVLTLAHLKFNSTPTDRAEAGTLELKIDIKKNEKIFGYLNFRLLALGTENSNENFSRGTSQQGTHEKINMTTRLGIRPNADAKEWILRLRTIENVPSLIRVEDRFRTRIKVPLRDELRGPALRDFEPDENGGHYEELDEGIGVLIENEPHAWEKFIPFHILMWAPTHENWQWNIKNVRAFDGKKELTISPSDSSARPTFWNQKGKRMPPGTEKRRFSVTLNQAPRPESLWFALELEGQEYREYEFGFDFEPPRDQKITRVSPTLINNNQKAPEIVLHSYQTYKNKAELAGAKTSFLYIEPEGTAFVLEIPKTPTNWELTCRNRYNFWNVGNWQKPFPSIVHPQYPGNLIAPDSVPAPGKMFVTLIGSAPPQGVSSGTLSGTLHYLDTKKLSSFVEVKDIPVKPYKE